MSGNVQIRRELYIPSPGSATVWVNERYLGSGCRREELRFDQMIGGDFHQNFRRRTSEDNGRTWTGWQAIPDPPMKDGYTLIVEKFATFYDADTKLTLQATLHRLSEGAKDEGVRAWWEDHRKAYFDHMFVQWSDDDGRTWSAGTQLRYQDGPFFDPEDWAAKGFLSSNEMYGGYGFAKNREGAIVYPVSAPAVHRNEDGSVENVFGVVCLLGRWDARRRTYEWEASRSPITVPHRLSGRGLDEPAITVLGNGDLLMSMRGANVCSGPDPWRGTVESPGRAWVSVSKDGGRTWGPVTDLRYDTGEQFYVPSSLVKFLRSTKTGKLYWIGNIPRTRPAGDQPRYPLVLAEVDETIPALKKNAVTILGDRDLSTQAELVQFSNFSLLENRETFDIELVLPHFGERGLLANNEYDFTCDTWRYVITL